MQAKSMKLFTLGELPVLSLLAFLVFCYGEIAGVFSRHMIVHIALMTGVAPLLAGMIRQLPLLDTKFSGIKSLLAATLVQSALFFAWHSPPGLTSIAHGGGWGMQATLLFSALWFWLAVLNQADNHLWRAVIGLLLTGKLFCLVAVLLTFAPRVIYGADPFNPAITIDLADQQMAGVLMIIACPIAYVLASIVLVYRWFQVLCDSKSGVAPLEIASENGS
jgi:putative membrane protein